jgi:hypothetical protein
VIITVATSHFQNDKHYLISTILLKELNGYGMTILFDPDGTSMILPLILVIALILGKD